MAVKNITPNPMSFTDHSDKCLAAYMRELRRCQLLPWKEQLSLFEQMKAGGSVASEAREKLAKANMLFVVSTANEFFSHSYSKLDLIQAGNVGLLTAIDRFDPSRGNKFLSFAVWHIMKEILALIDMDESVKAKRQSQGRVVSINSPMGCGEGDEDFTLENVLKSNFRTDAQAEKESFRSSIRCEIRRILDKREQKAVTMYFGLDGKEYDLYDIADELGCCYERARQIFNEAKRKLQRMRIAC